MAALQTFFNSLLYMFFSFKIDQVCDRVHGLIRDCMSDSLAFNVVFTFKNKENFRNFTHFLNKSEPINYIRMCIGV